MKLEIFSKQYRNRIIHISLLISLTSVFLIMAVKGVTYAYNPPAGIPNPSGFFGGFDPIEGSAPPEPSPWTSDKPGWYYVDNTATNCSDSGNGNKFVPRCTIPTDLSPGDVVVITGGPYTGSYSFSRLLGTASNPIWIRGESGESKVEFAPASDETAITVEDSSYVYFENIYVNGKNCPHKPGMKFFENSNHFIIRNSEFKNFNDGSVSAAIHIGMSSGNINGNEPNNYYVLYNNTFRNIGVAAGDWGVDVSERSAIKTEYGVDHIWILNSDFREIGEDGVHIMNYKNNQSRGPHDGQPQYIYIGGNTFYRLGEQAVDVKSSEHVIISENVVHGQRRLYGLPWYDGDGGSYGNAFTVNNEDSDYQGVDQSADYTWIIYNTIYDCVLGIFLQSGRRNYIIGNVIYDMIGSSVHEGYGIWVAKVNTTKPASTAYVVNNTVVNTAYPLYVNGAYDFYSINNIWYELTDQSNYHMRIKNVKHSYVVKNDLFYDSTDVRLYKSFYGDDCYAGGASTDPKFEDVAGHNFRLKSDSPAIDSGFTSSVYDTFYNLYGISIKRDRSGVSRPQGSAWDIGAYEAASQPAPPTSPGNLRTK